MDIKNTKSEITIKSDSGKVIENLQNKVDELNNQKKDLIKCLEGFTILDPNYYKDISGFIISAKDLLNRIK
jgi:hypothetical protein